MNILLTVSLVGLSMAAPQAEKLKILTTTPELRDIATVVGGDLVEASSLLKGPEDPHFADARPSSIKLANRADVFIKNGMSLEIGYEPLIVGESRNRKISPGGPGYIDASARIAKIEVPTGAVDRSMGDVHPEGNPHYLLDPVNGKIVAQSLRDSLMKLLPDRTKEIEERCNSFSRSIDVAMFGEKILAKHTSTVLAEHLHQGTLEKFLSEKGDSTELSGFAATMLPYSGRPYVSFHTNLAYFAERFHLNFVGSLEPKPGVPPSASHLESIIQLMKAQSVAAVFHTTFQPAKPVEKVCAETGARAVLFPHQVGATPEATSYIQMLESIVRGAAAAFSQKSGK